MSTTYTTFHAPKERLLSGSVSAWKKALLKYYPFEYKALLQSLTQLEETSDENNEHLL